MQSINSMAGHNLGMTGVALRPTTCATHDLLPGERDEKKPPCQAAGGRTSSPSLALHLGVDPRRQALPGQTGDQVVGADVGHGVARLDRRAGDMWCDDAVWQ